MKRWVLILFIFLTGCADTFSGHILGLAGITSYQNEPDGFRNIKWGTEISSLSDFQLSRKEPQNITIYQKNNESMEIGAAKLQSIEYVFFNNKLHSVRIKTAMGQDNWINLRKSVVEKYGWGYSPNILLDNYFTWAGPIAMMELRNLYTFGMFTITSKKMAEELGEYQKKMAEKAANSDF